MSEQKSEKNNDRPPELETVERKATDKEVRENTVDSVQNKAQLDQALRSNKNNIADDSSVGEHLRSIDPTKSLAENEKAQKDYEKAQSIDSFGIDFGDQVYTTKGFVEKQKSSIDTKFRDENNLLADNKLGAHAKSGDTANGAAVDEITHKLKALGACPTSLSDTDLAILETDRTRLKNEVRLATEALKAIKAHVREDPVVNQCEQIREQKELSKRQLEVLSLPDQKRANHVLAEDLLGLGNASNPFITHVKQLNLNLPDTMSVTSDAINRSKLSQIDKEELLSDLNDLRLANGALPESENTSTRIQNLDFVEKLTEKGIVLPDERYQRNIERPETNIKTTEDFQRAEKMIRGQFIGETPKCVEVLQHLRNLQNATTEVNTVKARIIEDDQNLARLQPAEQLALKPVTDQELEIERRYQTFREVDKTIREGSFDSDLKIISQMNPSERAEIFEDLKKIAKDHGGSPNHLTEKQRMETIRDLTHQIAHPESIVQSGKETCGLASTEFELASKYPSLYARFASELLTRGHCSTRGGKLALNENVVNKDGHQNDALRGNRSLVSAVFQTAAADRFSTLSSGSHYQDSSGILKVTSSTGFSEGGEEIVKDGQSTKWTGTDQHVLSQLQSELTGDKYEFVPIVVDRSKGEQGWTDAEAKFIATVKDQKMPINAAIMLHKDDFTGMNAEGGHAISLTLITGQKPGEVMVNFNNTASGTDHGISSGAPIPLRDFIKAMQDEGKTRGLIIKAHKK